MAVVYRIYMYKYNNDKKELHSFSFTFPGLLNQLGVLFKICSALSVLWLPPPLKLVVTRHDIIERDVFTLLSAIAFYVVVLYVILSRVHLCKIT